MKKLTINEAADKLGITKEAIYNRIRRGSVKTIVEDGERYVVFDDEKKVSTTSTNKQEKDEKPPVTKQKTDINFSIQYMNLLISQIDELKKTNQELNQDKDRLIKEKEELLIEQRDMVERIYKERDEQLKIMLTLTNRTLLANPSTLQKTTIEAQLENRIKSEQETNEDSDWFRLKTILKEKGYSKKKKKKILSNAKDFLGVDENIIENDGEIYIKGNTDFEEVIKG
ncbi:MAG: hypothetical protein LBG67_00815 [Campylobacteraceae bacterium]|nr:hypothetical protein [Campylobacteraceae bacterium]